MTPIYSLLCPCGSVSEHLLAIAENDTVVLCPNCGSGLTRDNNRTYKPTDAPTIKGETVVRIQKIGTKSTWNKKQSQKKARKKTTELK